MKIKQLLTILFALTVAPLVSRAAQVDYFLKLEGIAGDATDKGHANEIEVLSFSWGVSNPGSQAVGGGAGAGKVNIRDISFVKRSDKSSPKLMVACATGKHIPTAVLTVRKGNGRGGIDFLVITLEDIVITSYQIDGGSSDTTDAVSINFSKITMKTYDGASGHIDVGDGEAN